MDGLREFVQGRKAKALKCFGKSDHGDSAFLAGVLSLMLERFEDASRHFLTARSKSGDLGRLFSKYGVLPRCTLDITEQITVDIEPNVRGAQLGLVEAAQRLKKWDVVVQALQHLRRLEPDDPVVKLSLVEAILDAAPANKSIHQRVIRLTKDVDNATPIHTALLLYKARALRALKLTSAAQATLTKAMRRKKNRPADLLRELRYERATLYEDEGQAKRARADLERIYAEAPGFADVAERLGFKAT
ncbi:MAG: DUF4236 domain-containing protein [Phycisphaerae bacterium]